MGRRLATALLFCLLISSSSALAKAVHRERDRDRDKKPPEPPRVVRLVIKALGDFLSPPKP